RGPGTETLFRALIGRGTAFPPGAGLRLADLADGPGRTLLVAEASRAVPWTKPEELPCEPEGPLPALGGHFADGFHALLGHGRVLFVRRDADERLLRQAIARDDAK